MNFCLLKKWKTVSSTEYVVLNVQNGNVSTIQVKKMI